jgi:hypothetical protein
MLLRQYAIKPIIAALCLVEKEIAGEIEAIAQVLNCAITLAREGMRIHL